MNHRIHQKLWALGSLITIFFISANLRQTAIETAGQVITEHDTNKIQQYRWAKWNYRLADLLLLKKVNAQGSKDAAGDRDNPPLSVAIVENNLAKLIGEPEYKRGYVDRQGQIVIPAVFDAAREFSGDFAVVKFRGKYGIIDRQGQIITPFMFDYIYSFAIEERGGFIAAKIDGKEGRTDIDGKTIVPFVYDSIESYSIVRNYVVATKGRKQGVTTLAGKTLLPFKHDGILKYTADFTIVKNDGDIGVIDRENDRHISLEVRPRTYHKINGDLFLEDVAMLRFQDNNTERYCVVNRQGEILVSARSIRPIKQQKINNLCRSVAEIEVNNNLLKSANYPANSPENQEKSYEQLFSDGLLKVQINGKTEYVNPAGELVTWTNKFDQIGDFSEGLAPFVKDDKSGFVDRQGKIAFYLKQDFVAANYVAQHNNHYYTNTIDWIFFPDEFSNFKNGLAKITHMDAQSLSTGWECPAYEESPLGEAVIDKTGKIVKYEPIIPPPTVYNRAGGHGGDYQDVECDLGS